MKHKVAMHGGVTRNSCEIGDRVVTELAVVIWFCGSSTAKQDMDCLG